MENNPRVISRFLVLIAALIAGLWMAAKIAPFLEVLVIAGLLAYLLYPLVGWIVRWSRIPHATASKLVFFGFVIFLIAIPASLGTVALSQWSSEVRSELNAIGVVVEQWISLLMKRVNVNIAPHNFIELMGSGLVNSLAPLPGQSISLLTEVSLNIFWVVLVFVTKYYLLKSGPELINWLLSRVPEDHRPEIERLVEELDRVWRVFIRVQLLIFVILVCLMALGTMGIIWLFRSGLLAFSPVLLILLLILVYTGVQQVDNLWLRPRWMGRHLNLHPGLVVASLIGALAVGGLLLAVLIVPVLATAKVLGGYVYRKLHDLPAWPEEVKSKE